MKITLLRGKVVNGEPQKVGTTLEVEDKDGKHLIATGAAKAGGKKDPDPDPGK